MSFYYWRPVFAPDSTETSALQENQVRTLYVRYFEVDRPDGDSTLRTGATIRFDSSPSGYSIVPVIHFQSRVFEKMDSSAIPSFTRMILDMIRRIDTPAHLQPDEIQFDCNWTEPARIRYFSFLRHFAILSGSVISSTIHLQHLKGSESVPPVDHGVLVYEKPIAHRYTPALRSYPLPMDLALPITSPVSADDLLEMVSEVRRHSNHQLHNLIFFYIDRENLARYKKGFFKEVLDHTD
ncbi:MAG TPA: hypothetical protein VNU70_03630 [Puia sp.]|jgi:hypothetical protein|nr:hypothetical protein [Puia sp.]